MHVINPANLSVVKTISEDNEGNPLNNVGSSGGAANMSRSWNDAVLAQVHYMLQLTSETFLSVATWGGSVQLVICTCRTLALMSINPTCLSMRVMFTLVLAT